MITANLNKPNNNPNTQQTQVLVHAPLLHEAMLRSRHTEECARRRQGSYCVLCRLVRAWGCAELGMGLGCLSRNPCLVGAEGHFIHRLHTHPPPPQLPPTNQPTQESFIKAIRQGKAARPPQPLYGGYGYGSASSYGSSAASVSPTFLSDNLRRLSPSLMLGRQVHTPYHACVISIYILNTN